MWLIHVIKHARRKSYSVCIVYIWYPWNITYSLHILNIYCKMQDQDNVLCSQWNCSTSCRNVDPSINITLIHDCSWNEWVIFIQISAVYTYVFLWKQKEREREREKSRTKEREPRWIERESEQARTANSSAPSRAFRFRAAISSDPAVASVFERPVRAPQRNRTGSSAQFESNSDTERVRTTNPSEAEAGSRDSIKRHSEVEADSRGQFGTTQQGRAGSQRDFN